MENNNTPAVKDTAKHSVKGFIAALNAKRKKLMLSISTMVAMSMITAISAFADGGGAGTSNAGEEQFNTVIQFLLHGSDVSVLLSALSAQLCSVWQSRTMTQTQRPVVL